MDYICHVFHIWVCFLLIVSMYVLMLCTGYIGMYLTDLTFLDLGRKKNGTFSTPTTPVSKFADYSRRTPPSSNIQAQVSQLNTSMICYIEHILSQIDAIHNTIGYFQNSSYGKYMLQILFYLWYVFRISGNV